MKRYGDMPETAPSRKLDDGTIISAPQPQMMCEDCNAGPYSATRGDYFQHPDDEEVICSECGGSMVLVREVHYFEPVTS